MYISVAHYLVYYHESIHPQDNVDQCYRTHVAAADMSTTHDKLITS